MRAHTPKHHLAFALPFPTLTIALNPPPLPPGPPINPLLRIQEPAIVKRRRDRPASSTNTNRVNTSTRREYQFLNEIPDTLDAGVGVGAGMPAEAFVGVK